MPRVVPQPDLADAAAVRGIALEAPELLVGDAFADHTDQPEADAGDLQRVCGRRRIDRRGEERNGEQYIEQPLPEKKNEKLEGQISTPLCTELGVPPVLRFVRDTMGEMHRESDAPDSAEDRGDDPALRETATERGVENREQADARRPADVHN